MTVMHLLLVAIGGFFGAIARFRVSRKLNGKSPVLPIGTLTVNLLGSFLLGLITGSAAGRLHHLLDLEAGDGADERKPPAETAGPLSSRHLWRRNPARLCRIPAWESNLLREHRDDALFCWPQMWEARQDYIGNLSNLLNVN